jgi:hypothetical protein
VSPPRLAALLILSAIGCSSEVPDRKVTKPTTSPSLIALSRMEDGSVVLCDAATLTTVRRLVGGPAKAPMLIAADFVRRQFYVGNYRGGLARVPWDGGAPEVMEMGGPSIGLAVDPRGALLAVNGAFDLQVTLVDLDTWKARTTTSIGDAHDPPKHSHLTHGLASTHPYFEPDGSGVVTEDNVHEELVRIDRDGRVVGRLPMPSAVHSLVPRPAGGWLAVGEGAVDGSVKPFIGFVGPHAFELHRVTTLPLRDAEKAKLHHADVSGDQSLLVVANMGPMHGAGAGRSVHAIDLATGEIQWIAEGPKNAGHVRFLDGRRVAVLGHGAGVVTVLDARDGQVQATWEIPGASTLGHALQLEDAGSLLVIDTSQGRIVRLRAGSVAGTTEAFGPGTWEASLRE